MFPVSIGICLSVSGADGAVTDSAGANTCVLVTAATAMPAGAVPGEPVEPRPKESRSFPAAITGATPAAAVFLIVTIMASLTGSVSGPPPDKLITFIPSAAAASNAATISGVFATFPTGVGTVKTR